MKKTLKIIIDYLTVIILAITNFIKRAWVMFQEYHQEETRSLALRNTAIQNEQNAVALANEISSFLQAVAPALAKYGIDSDSYLYIRILETAGDVFFFAVPKRNLNQDFHPNQLALIARRLNQDICKFRNLQMMRYGTAFPSVFPCLSRGIQFIEMLDNSVEIIMKVRI